MTGDDLFVFVGAAAVGFIAGCVSVLFRRAARPRDTGGWYVFTAPLASMRVATDKVGPFASRGDIMDWLKENGIDYRPNAEAYSRAVAYHNEMRDDDFSGENYAPWATAIHRVS